jgi:PAS domain S-box-containing protein
MAKKESVAASAVPGEDFRRESKGLHQQLKEIIKIQEKKDRKRAQETRKKYYSYLDKIADPVFIYDALSYRFLHCNESFIKHFGYSDDEILSMTPFDLHKPEDFEKVRENIDKRTLGTPKKFTYLTKDRRQRIVEIMTEDIFFEGNPAWMTIVHDVTEHIVTEEELKKSRLRLEEILGERKEEVLLATQKLTREIEERKKAEDAIRESEVKFRNIIEKSLDGIILVDEKGSIIEWNKGQETIYGIKRAMVAGKKIWDVQFQHEPQEKRVDENYKQVKKVWENFLKTGINPFQNKEQVSKIERPDSQLRDIQQLYFTIETDTGKGFMMACTTRDITDRLVMEKQLVQSQKMEAMGTLAGGIAHDFNNILGGIIGYTELAVRTLDKKSPVQKYLKQVLTASKRASDLVKQILIFSRREKKEKEPVQMSLIVKEAIKLLRSSLPAAIEIVSKIEDNKSFILADPTQIHQVIMNLCTNAAHAMKDKGGMIEVRLNNETVEPGLYKELKAGPHLRLSISDTGHGIKQEMIDKIFEPFFTTKKAEEGTGMGLAVVHGIVKSYNGNISVYSKEGQGTTFSILFPIVVDVIHKQEKQEEEIPRGSERILLVEDDSSLADAEKELFEELGYNVTKVTSGIEAFEIFRKVPNRFDIIITDYSMPKMTGGELISKIRSIKPGIPIILCTGFSHVITPAKVRSIGIGDIIMKPIELGQIAKSIRKLLDKK